VPLISMNPLSPTAQGFRLIFRRPLIPLAEIVWRWSFVAAAGVLITLFFVEYTDSLPVTRAQQLLLGIGQPILISRALHRIFRGSALRFTEAGILVAMGLVVAWIVLASLGRAATIHSVADEFCVTRAETRRGRLASLAALNFLRATVTLAAVASAIGAMLLASSLWASTHISAADASRFLFLVAFFVWADWVFLNWFLSVCAVFAALDDAPALAAMLNTVRLCQQKPSPVLTAGALFGLAHLAAFVTASFMGLMLFSVLGALAPRLVWFAQLLLIAAYCAVADFLYTGRLATYMAIIQGEQVGMIAAPVPTPPSAPPELSSPVDRDELILGDVPLPAT
jgi:hypothetical protein